MPVRLQSLDVCGFLLRRRAGDDVVDAKRPPDRARGGLVVAAQHDDAQPFSAQRRKRGRGGRLHRVGNADAPGECAIGAHEQHAFARGAALFVLSFDRRGNFNPQLRHQRAVAERNLAPVHHPGDALARQRLKPLGLARRHPVRERAFDHRRRQRMLAVLLQRGGPIQQLRAVAVRRCR